MEASFCIGRQPDMAVLSKKRRASADIMAAVEQLELLAANASAGLGRKRNVARPRSTAGSWASQTPGSSLMDQELGIKASFERLKKPVISGIRDPYEEHSSIAGVRSVAISGDEEIAARAQWREDETSTGIAHAQGDDESGVPVSTPTAAFRSMLRTSPPKPPSASIDKGSKGSARPSRPAWVSPWPLVEQEGGRERATPDAVDYPDRPTSTAPLHSVVLHSRVGVRARSSSRERERRGAGREPLGPPGYRLVLEGAGQDGAVLPPRLPSTAGRGAPASPPDRYLSDMANVNPGLAAFAAATRGPLVPVLSAAARGRGRGVDVPSERSNNPGMGRGLVGPHPASGAGASAAVHTYVTTIGSGPRARAFAAAAAAKKAQAVATAQAAAVSGPFNPTPSPGPSNDLLLTMLLMAATIRGSHEEAAAAAAAAESRAWDNPHAFPLTLDRAMRVLHAPGALEAEMAGRPQTRMEAEGGVGGRSRGYKPPRVRPVAPVELASGWAPAFDQLYAWLVLQLPRLVAEGTVQLGLGQGAPAPGPPPVLRPSHPGLLLAVASPLLSTMQDMLADVDVVTLVREAVAQRVQERLARGLAAQAQAQGQGEGAGMGTPLAPGAAVAGLVTGHEHMQAGASTVNYLPGNAGTGATDDDDDEDQYEEEEHFEAEGE